MVPSEVVAQYRLRDLAEADNVVRIRNWRIRPQDRMHRIYLEYLPFGDAWKNVVAHYRQRRHQDGRVDQGAWLAEPFIWHTFESLSIAGQLMAHGGMEPNPFNGWHSMVHRDIKLANMFLSYPRKDRYRKFPSVKLGDFGYAVFMAPNDPRPPPYIRAVGTPGARAPEQDLSLIHI